MYLGQAQIHCESSCLRKQGRVCFSLTEHELLYLKKNVLRIIYTPKQDGLNGKRWDEIGTPSDHQWKNQELHLHSKMNCSVLETQTYITSQSG